jgi:hypothetical protein
MNDIGRALEKVVDDYHQQLINMLDLINHLDTLDTAERFCRHWTL